MLAKIYKLLLDFNSKLAVPVLDSDSLKDDIENVDKLLHMDFQNLDRAATDARAALSGNLRDEIDSYFRKRPK